MNQVASVSISLTEQRNAPFGESLLILADAVVGAKVCGIREGDLQRHGRLVHAVLLQSQSVLPRPLLDELPVVALPVVDRGRIRLHRALHRGGGAVVAAQHLSVDADEGRDCKIMSLVNGEFNFATRSFTETTHNGLRS